MVFDVLSFGTKCDEILEEALSATGLLVEKSDLTGDLKIAVKRAEALVKSGQAKAVVCSVSLPPPLIALQLLCAVKDSTNICKFYLFAETANEFDLQVPDTLPPLRPLNCDNSPQITDREAASLMGAKAPLIGLTATEIRQRITSELGSA